MVIRDMTLNLTGIEPGRFGVLSSSELLPTLPFHWPHGLSFFCFPLHITLHNALLATASTYSWADFFVNLVYTTCHDLSNFPLHQLQ